MDRLPSWLRWLLVLPASIAAAVLMQVIIIFWVRVNPLWISPLPDLVIRLFASYIIPFAFISVGGRVAPKYRLETVGVLAALALLAYGVVIGMRIVAGVVVLEDWWLIAEWVLSTILFVAGMGNGIYDIYGGRQTSSP